MFRLILVLSCVVAALAQLEHPAPEPYSFAFSSPNEDGTSSAREETQDASGRITGSYTILGADGQQRRVEYVADADGFRANVITNEIGTESQHPADVQLQSSAPTAAELSHQWEASGLGKARLAGPGIGAIRAVGPVPAIAPLPVAAPVAVAAKPVFRGGLIGGAVGINRGLGLVGAPVAPIAGGLVGGFGIRGVGPAPIAPVAPIAIAPKVAAPVAPLGLGVNSLGVSHFNLGAPLGLAGGYGGLPLNGVNSNVLLLSRGQLSDCQRRGLLV